MAVPSPASSRRIVDITAGLTEDLVTWPGVVERFERSLLTSLDAGDPMTVSHFRLGAHAGTHVDAPGHFLAHGAGVESVSLEALVGPAFVGEVAPGHEVITADILESIGVPAGTRRFLAKTRNSGWSTNGAPFQEDFVAFDESAVDWCLARDMRLVGIDYLSVEPFDAEDRGYPVHKRLLSAGTVIVESLDLAGVDPGAYELIVLPLLVPGADGAPARAILIAD